MVCLGNICRSPLAEGILAHKLEAHKFMVDSAGTAAYHTGNPPDPRSQEVALEHGINIGQQRARPFIMDDFDRFDHIYVMDCSNLANLKALEPTAAQWEKVQLLLGDAEVPDPYYGGPEGFKEVYQMIDRATDTIANQLQTHDG